MVEETPLPNVWWTARYYDMQWDGVTSLTYTVGGIAVLMLCDSFYQTNGLEGNYLQVRTPSWLHLAPTTWHLLDT
jgi:hypothetical protein